METNFRVRPLSDGEAILPLDGAPRSGSDPGSDVRARPLGGGDIAPASAGADTPPGDARSGPNIPSFRLRSLREDEAIVPIGTEAPPRRTSDQGDPLPTGPKPAERGLAADLGRAAAQGALQTTASAAESFAGRLDRRQRRIATLQARLEEAPSLSDEDFADLQREIAGDAALPSSRRAQLNNVAARLRRGDLDAVPDIAATLDGNLARRSEEAISGAADTLQPSQAREGSLALDVARGVGSTAPFVAARAATGPLGLLGFSVATGQGEALERAARNGASDADAAQAQLLGTLPGATDLAPIENLFRAAPIAPGLKGAIAGVARAAVQQGIVEGTQESLQSFLQNGIERITSDEGQSLIEGIPENARTGALVGLLFGTAGGSAQAAGRNLQPRETVDDGARRAAEAALDEAVNDGAADLPAQGETVRFRRFDGSEAEGRVVRQNADGVGVVVEPVDQPGAQEFVGRRLIVGANGGARGQSGQGNSATPSAQPQTQAQTQAQAQAQPAPPEAADPITPPEAPPIPAPPEAEAPPTVTPEDEASPIPTDLIAEGRRIVAEGAAGGLRPGDTARGRDDEEGPASAGGGSAPPETAPTPTATTPQRTPLAPPNAPEVGAPEVDAPETGAPEVGAEVAATLRDGTEARGRVVEVFQEPRGSGRTAPAVAIDTGQGTVNAALDRDQVRAVAPTARTPSPVPSSPAPEPAPAPVPPEAAGLEAAPAAADAALAPDAPASTGRPRGGRPRSQQRPRRPVSAVRALIDAGGVRDDRGEIRRGLGVTGRTRPGLINDRDGVPLDQAAIALQEMGFFPGRDRADLTRDDVLDVIDEDVNRGRPLFTPEGREIVDAENVRREGTDRAALEDEASRLGIPADRARNLGDDDLSAAVVREREIQARDLAPEAQAAEDEADAITREVLAQETLEDAPATQTVRDDTDIPFPDVSPGPRPEPDGLGTARGSGEAGPESAGREAPTPRRPPEGSRRPDAQQGTRPDVTSLDPAASEAAGRAFTQAERDAIRTEAEAAQAGFDRPEARNPFPATSNLSDIFEAGRFLARQGGARPSEVRRGQDNTVQVDGARIQVDGDRVSALDAIAPVDSAQPANTARRRRRQASDPRRNALNNLTLDPGNGAWVAAAFNGRRGIETRVVRARIRWIAQSRPATQSGAWTTVGTSEPFAQTASGEAQREAMARRALERARDFAGESGEVITDIAEVRRLIESTNVPDGAAGGVQDGRGAASAGAPEAASTGDPAPGQQVRPDTPGASERTPEGEQQLVEGVAPVRDRDRADVGSARDLSGQGEQADSGDTPLGDVSGRGQGALFSAPDGPASRSDPNRDVRIAEVQPRFSQLESNQQRSAARRFARDELRGQVVRNRDTGQAITIGSAGIDKATSGRRSGADLDVLTRLPDLLENAVRVDQQPDRRARRSIDAVSTFIAAADIGGRIHRVRLTVRQAPDGSFFYDQHTTEVGAADALAAGRPGPGDRAPFAGSPTATVKLGDLLRDVNAAGNTRFSAPDAGSVVDDQAIEAGSPAAPFPANGSKMARPGVYFRQSPDFDGQRTALAERLQKIATDTFGPDLNVAVLDDIHGDVGHGLSAMLGAYTDVRMPGGALENFAAVSLGAENAEFQLNHEGIHHLRRMGALDGKRWEALEARAAEWRRRFDIDARYPGLSEDMKNEEAVADAFAAFAAGDPRVAPLEVRPTFSRMQRFFERFKSVLQGRGFQRFDDIFEEIQRGDLARDPDGDRLGAMPRFSVAPRKASSTGAEKAINKAVQADDARGVVSRLRDSLADRARRTREEFVWAVADEFNPLLGLEKKVRGVERDRDAMAWTAARLSRHSSGQIEAFLRHGAPAWDADEQIATFKEGSKGFFEILRPIYEDGTFRLFEGYAYARRVRSQGLIESGKEKNLSQSEVDELLALANEHPQFEQVFEEIQAYKTSVLDFAEQLGLVGADQRAVWEQADHVPFHRVAEDEGATAGPGQRRGLSGQDAQIRRLTGGEDRFLVIDQATGTVTGRFADLAEANREAKRLGGEHSVERGGQAIPGVVENLVRNMAHLIDASMKNNAANEAVALALEAGIATRESSRLKPEVGPGSQFERTLREAGVDTSLFQDQALRAKLTELGVQVPKDASLRRVKELAAQNDLDPDQFPAKAMETIFAVAPPKGLGKDTLAVKVGGETQFFRIDDKLVFKAIEGTQRTGMMLQDSPFVRPFSMARTFFTRMITLSPEFGARNFVRDSVSSWVQTPERSRNIAKDMMKAGTEAAQLIKKNGADDRLKAIQAAGADTGFFANAPEDVVNQLRRLQREKKIGIVDLANPKTAFDLLDRLGRGMEQANRVTIFDQVLEQTGSRRAAVFESADIMDFQLRGGSPAVQVMTQIVPFLNARIQGLYRLGRAGFGSDEKARRSFLMKGGMLAAAATSLAVWNATDDDEENGYNALPEWLKDTYYVVPIGRALPEDVRESVGLPRFLTIPKPFEVGAIFSTIPERMVQALAGNDRAQDSGDAAWRAIRDTFAFDPFSNPLTNVPLEQALNRNRFQDRPIVPRREQGLEPEVQFDPRFTSPVMRQIGEETGLSPRRLESVFDGFFGTIGAYGLGIADSAYRVATQAPPQPAARLDEMMFLRSFTAQEPLRSTKWAGRFWDLKVEADGIHRTINLARRRGQRAIAEEKLRENRGLLRARGQLDAIANQLGNLRKREQRIFDDPTLSPERKRDLLDEIQAQENALVRRVGPLEEFAGR